MMQIEIERRKYTRPFLDMTPMIDVVFQLVLFFVLTSHAINEPVIKIVLPESKTAVDIDGATLTISVSSSAVFLEDREVAVEGLGAALKSRAAQEHATEVRIKADRRADIGRLVQVIDQVRMADMKNFAIVTEEAAGP